MPLVLVLPAAVRRALASTACSDAPCVHPPASLPPGLIIDARSKGNLARLLNSSCDPNCETQKWHDAGNSEVRRGAWRGAGGGSAELGVPAALPARLV